MRELEYEQRSEEWHEARRGVITGSRVKKVFAKSNTPFAYELVAEKLTEHIEDTYVSPAMQWGIDQEPYAIKELEMEIGKTVIPYGLCLHDKYNFWGHSPDGILEGCEVKTGIEIKCPNSVTHIKYIHQNKLPSEYKHQVFNMFCVCGVDRVLFVSYDPRVEQNPLHILEVNKSDYLKELEDFEAKILAFNEKVSDIYNEIIF